LIDSLEYQNVIFIKIIAFYKKAYQVFQEKKRMKEYSLQQDNVIRGTMGFGLA
jgi:hypothetical protein